jgi:hypothetical protein
MDRREWPHSRARLGEKCAPRIGLGRGSLTGGGSLDEAQRVARGGLVGRNGKSHRARLGRKCAPRIDVERGSLARGSGLDEAQRSERSGLVGSDRQSHRGKCAPRIDLGRGALTRGSGLDWAQRIERSGVVGRDGQRGSARFNRRESRELFLGHASVERRLERDLRRHGAFYVAFWPRAHRPAKHGAHLFRAEAAWFSFAARELTRHSSLSSNAGRASP